MENNFFKLYANCIPVKGAKRSLICDLQRNSFKFIPNSLYELIINDFQVFTLEELRGKYDHEMLDEYIQFLENNEFGFWCSCKDMERFPQLNLDWDFPAKITNAIIDIKDILHNFQKIFTELSQLGCKYIQIRFYKNHQFEAFKEIVNVLEGSIIKSVQFVIPYWGSGIEVISKNIGKLSHRISFIIITGAPFEKIIKRDQFTNTNIFFIKKEFISNKSCGVIDPKNFFPGLKLFQEAQKFNTCLNRKISVDENGNIKNCPSSSESFGNINITTLHQVIKNPRFTQKWNISKDEIEVCKECEFRYICVDCRVYLDDLKNIYSKPAKCKYDPYSTTFKN
jgi:SPASM domain peptide maturase of grasp-with-spasm system